MKLWVFSDLHFDPAVPRHNRGIDVPEADIAVVAGDISSGGIRNAIEWLKHNVLPAMPAIYVPGNHEYYSTGLMEERDFWRHLYRSGELPDGLHLLDCDAVELGGVRVLGATLWADFNLAGQGMPGVRREMRAAQGSVRDYDLIDWRRLPQRERLTPERTRQLHQHALGWLTSELSEPRDTAIVVVTHHAPSPRSVHPRYLGSGVEAAYASDLEGLLESCGPDLWVHGHVHDSFDYVLGDTRVVCNPKGYSEENRAFDPALVIELEV